MLNYEQGALRSSVMCFTLIIFLYPVASAAKTSTGFANGFANGLYESMGGCTEGLNSVLIYGVKADGESPFNCASFNGEDCTVGDMAASIIGLIIAPIITIFLCCGFCCGRCFQFCKCCCKPCGAEECGGRLPTKAVYPGWEQGLTWALLGISWVAIFCFSITGYASFVDFKTNWEDLVDGGVALYGGPDLVKGDINVAISKIKTDATSFITDEVNPLFEGLDPVRNNLRDLKTNLNALKTSVQHLQRYIEGCDTTAPGWTDGSCSVDSANFHTACTSTETEHYTTGQGVVMSDNTVAPNCQVNVLGDPGPCPCCADCAKVILDIQDVIEQLPAEARIDELDQPLDAAQIDSDVDEALGDWEGQIDSFEDGNEPLKWLDENQDDVKGYLGSGRVEGLATLFFLFPIIACVLIVAALALQFEGVKSGRKSDLPGYIWWTAFVIGVVHFIIIISPFWGAFSLLAIPYGGFCEAPTGTNYDVTVEKFLSNCLFDGSQHIWPLVDPPIERSTISENLADFNAREKIDAGAIDDVLNDVDAYTGSYNQDDIDGLDSAENKDAFRIAQDCAAYEAPGSTTADCDAFLARMSTYERDIDTRVAAIKAAGANVQALIDSTKTQAGSFKADIDKVFVRTDELLARMVDTAWEVGKCTRFNSLYTGIAAPFDGILDAFIATWAALFMVFVFTPVLLCSMCHGAKIMHSQRHAGDSEGGKQAESTEPAADASSHALTSVVPPMPNNGIETQGAVKHSSLVYPSGGPGVTVPTGTESGLTVPTGMPTTTIPQKPAADKVPTPLYPQVPNPANPPQVPQPMQAFPGSGQPFQWPQPGPFLQYPQPMPHF
mmetsp:Transcript_42733/g.100433  ORF Transcript_42733/g.100433 Transcript_42733/m.100433 type:complete len:836 (-) Transcript_42733:249-2756(-)